MATCDIEDWRRYVRPWALADLRVEQNGDLTWQGLEDVEEVKKLPVLLYDPPRDSSDRDN